MRPCSAILGLVLFPLAFGCLLGIAIANSLITALEDEQRGRREAERFARDTELRWMLRDTAVRGPVIETVYDGGTTANVN